MIASVAHARTLMRGEGYETTRGSALSCFVWLARDA